MIYWNTKVKMSENPGHPLIAGDMDDFILESKSL